MLKKTIHKFQGDKKYFTIVFFILILILISAVYTPRIIESNKENWNDELTNQINSVEQSVSHRFETKMYSQLQLINKLKSNLRNIFVLGDEAYREIIRVLNQKTFEDYSIGIFAPNGRMIAWNNPVIINQNELFPLTNPLGEFYFLEKELIVYLSQTDTVTIDNDIFYLTISKPIEKKYRLNNKFYKKVSFVQELIDENGIEFEVSYNPFLPKTKDGMKYSFDLLNNAGSKIGLVTFFKPTLVGEINKIKEKSSNIQSVLVLLIILFSGFGMRSDYKMIKSRLVKILFLFLFLSIGRTVIFLIGFPSVFMAGPLADPSNFSSVFGWGIVKSPVEFFITNIFVLILAVQIYRYTRDYFLTTTAKRLKYTLKIFSVPLLILFLLLLRAISASAKSVIFDSTIRYFRETDIIPNLSSLLMNLNILLLTVSILLIMLGILYLVIKAWGVGISERPDRKVLLFSILMITLSVLFYYLQKEPLVSLFMTILFTIMILILFLYIRFKNAKSVFYYVFITLTASIISVSLLNFFNVKLERESLKTTAFEINRANENLLQFLLDETLRNSTLNEEVKSAFSTRYVNYDAIAYKIWSASPIQRESLNSFVALYDRNKNVIGRFIIGFDESVNPFSYIKPVKTDEPIIREIIQDKNPGSKTFLGLYPFYEREILQGYISVAVSFDLQSIGAVNFPDFLESSTSILNKVVDIRQLKIFEFTNNNLTQVYGDRYPSREHIKEILAARLSEYDDGWITLNFEGENHTTFLFQTVRNDQEKLTAVLVAEKQFSWNLFNFFKIFIIHSFFVLILIVVLFVTRVKKINYSFKSKLLIAFLIVSIIPVISLAIYNRQVVSSRGEDAIISELRERSLYIENHTQYQRSKNPKRDLSQIFENAARELNIAYSIYKSTDEIYNSKDVFKRIGMFDSKLNSEAHYFINYLRFKEYLTTEKIENYNFNVLYRTITLDGEEYILAVNDAFNKIRVSLSTIEIDVVIFGIYSFAVILIIIVSTLFANQISYPIRRLTKAADSVGQGDLNIKIDHNERGELKELLDGFNAMTSELQKNQAELAELEREAAWKEMAKQVAHEIKNPLTPMKLALQQLVIANKDKNKDFDSLFDKVSKTVLNQIENLSQIASEFSRFAKMPSLNLEIIDLVSVINDTLNLYQDEKIKIDFKSDCSFAPVEADKSHLRRVFINLIRNSIQADANLINISLEKISENYSVLVKDNGQGINSDDKSKIFDQNFTTKKQGMGLGLAITRRFLESINGSIKLVSSAYGETSFEIIIPAFDKETKS